MVDHRTMETGMAALTGLFGVATMVGASEYGIGWSPSGPEPGMFPFYIGLIVLLASLGNAWHAIRMPAEERPEAPFVTRQQLALLAGFALPMIAFVATSLWLGLYVGMALYLFGTLFFQQRYAAWKAGALALGFPIFFYFLIERTFQVPLLKGPLEAMLGF